MNDIKCYDLDGNQIISFYQWDVNQKIVVTIGSFDVINDNNLIPPTVYFCNKNSDYATPVQSKISGDNFVIEVPNELLTESIPIEISFYFTRSNDTSSKRTLGFAKIPVIKSKKRGD